MAGLIKIYDEHVLVNSFVSLRNLISQYYEWMHMNFDNLNNDFRFKHVRENNQVKDLLLLYIYIDMID